LGKTVTKFPKNQVSDSKKAALNATLMKNRKKGFNQSLKAPKKAWFGQIFA